MYNIFMVCLFHFGFIFFSEYGTISMKMKEKKKVLYVSYF